MQIVAQGAQDKYISKNPEITFFKTLHRRHTNFAVESIEQTFDGSVPRYGATGTVSATISRNGDLVSAMWVEVDLPAIQKDDTDTAENAARTRTAGDVYELIDNITVSVGGQMIERHYGDWMRISDDLTVGKGGRKDNLDAVRSWPKESTYKGLDVDGVTHMNADVPARKVRIPLSFWFCKEPGQALPLIALQYHEVKVAMAFTSVVPTDTKVSLWADYVYLDSEERKKFAKQSHEYLIEQLQTTGKTTLSGSSTKIRMTFNHPIKELVWTTEAYKVADDTALAEPIKSARLELNGHDRFAVRDAAYFKEVQQYQHHSGSANAYVYSFALDPEKLQPSGSCNFSRIDNASLHLNTEPIDGTTNKDGSTRIYAVNYNVLRVKNGMGGLAYSN